MGRVRLSTHRVVVVCCALRSSTFVRSFEALLTLFYSNDTDVSTER